MKTIIRKEYQDLLKNPISNCGITVGLFNENDIRNWKVSIPGAKDTPYKRGLFLLSISFPPEYPQKAPEVCFITPIYHLNVNPKAPTFEGDESLGHVCFSTLNWWKPDYSIRTVLTNIFALFYMGDPDSPYGLDRADEFRNNRSLFEEKIKKFTRKYACPMKGFKLYPKDQDWDFSL